MDKFDLLGVVLDQAGEIQVVRIINKSRILDVYVDLETNQLMSSRIYVGD